MHAEKGVMMTLEHKSEQLFPTLKRESYSIKCPISSSLEKSEIKKTEMVYKSTDKTGTTNIAKKRVSFAQKDC